MIFPDCGPVLGLDELAGHARAHDFAQAVDVGRVDPEPPLDLGAHALGPRLGAENADPHRRRARIDALALKLVGDGQHVGRRHQYHACTEFGDELHLALAEAARHRHHRAAQPLGAVVRPEPAGEQAVAEGIVNDVARSGAASIQGPRHQVRPSVDVARRIAHHCGPARRTAGRMQAHALFARDRQHAEGIGVAQIVLRGEGEAAKIVQALEIVGMNARRHTFGAIRRLPLIGLPQGGTEPLHLQGAQFVEGDFCLGKQFRRHDLLVLPFLESESTIRIAQADQRRAQTEEREDAQQAF